MESMLEKNKNTYSTQIKYRIQNSIIFTYLLVGGFLFLNLAIGFWKGRKITSFSDYAVADKAYGTAALVMTYFASLNGGGTIFTDTTDNYRK